MKNEKTFFIFSIVNFERLFFSLVGPMGVYEIIDLPTQCCVIRRVSLMSCGVNHNQILVTLGPIITLFLHSQLSHVSEKLAELDFCAGGIPKVNLIFLFFVFFFNIIRTTTGGCFLY
jgi:hypothetical protein